jgi:diguanylate cyclase (GGDEF)-like protein/PAS domain S-box-containing protein
MSRSSGDWLAHQLSEFLAEISSLPDKASAVARAVERAAEAMEAEICALVASQEVVASVGFPRGEEPPAELIEVVQGSRNSVAAPGGRRCAVAIVPVGEKGGRHLLLGRSDDDPLDAEEMSLLRAMGRVLDLSLGQMELVASLRASEERTRLIIGTANDAFVGMDSDGAITDWNNKAAKLFGWTLEDVKGRRLDETIIPIRYRESLQQVLRRFLTTGEGPVLGKPFEISAQHREGYEFPIELTIWAHQIGRVQHFNAFARDISERKKAEESLRRSETRFRSLVQNASDVIAVLDPDSTIRYVSPAVLRVGGFEPEELVGHRALDLLHTDDSSLASAHFQEILNRPGAFTTMELRARHRDGSWRWLEASAKNLLEDPGIEGIVVNYNDITARKELEEQLTHRAFHDPLTGLANRILFRDRVAQALAHTDRDDRLVAVMFLDLDDFKIINDSLGHEAGDKVLTAVAQCLEESLRQSDTAARLGGDEFALLVEQLTEPDEAIEVGKRLIELIRGPVSLESRDLFIEASIGIAIGGSEHDADQMLREADAAMYRAKGHGKSRFELYESEIHAAVLERLELRGDLQRALVNQEFLVHYQPIVVLDKRIIVGFEALVRWLHPSRGLIPPGAFIHIAEDSGAIVAIGRFVLYEACRQTRLWQLRHPSDPLLSVAVNLSARQFEQPGLTQEVAGALRESGLAPSDVTLEITESLLMEDTEATLSKLEELKELGVRLAVDDFGTGYSSLAYLERFPIDRLKIDKRFVDRVGMGEDAALARAIINLSSSLRLKTVAEGIEMAEQVNELLALGCEFGQGYHFSKPLPAREVDALLDGRAHPVVSQGVGAEIGR